MNSTDGNNSRDTHVLPKGLVKVRRYGLLANRHRAQRLAQSRRLLLPALAAAALTNAGPAQGAAAPKVEPAPARHCPQCGGCRFVRIELPTEAERATLTRDTS